MTINYKIIKTSQPGVKGGGNFQYIPRITNRRNVNTKELAELISEKCTLHKSDVVGVLSALTEEIPALLLKNCIIRLDDLGIFSLHATVVPSDNGEEVNDSKINGLRMAFRPAKDIKKLLKTAGYKKVKE